MRIPDELLRHQWNKRVLGYEELADCISREKRLLLLDIPLNGITKGFYGVFDGIAVIGIDENLRGIERLRVSYHELAHHYLHSPDFLLYDAVSEAKAQREANTIAACALIPLPLLLSHSFAELVEDGFPYDLIIFRAELWRSFRI
ncbi:MAG TPA: ImmA/IrrE family metallo-endopeptidase [Blastocatellia bacterium]|nr:ImmA/IrrE family metallo-endopeptidase [Blastocatellia bacterium]